MNYEQKYKEALERAKKELDACGSQDCDAARQIFRLFPELCESEDEKMVNQLHSWMKEFSGAEEYTEKVYQWLKGLIEKQKSEEWSEEDEHRTKDAIYFLEIARKKYPSDEEINKTINWLKLLKDRVQPQPKQEWSKADEHCIELLLPIIDSSSLIPKNRKKCKEFLKSIKPNHWKPSEEQMEALWDIIPHLPNCKEDVDKITILSTLYEELKNL